MTLFQYRTVQDGKDLIGTIDAPTLESATAMLEKNGIVAESVSEASRTHRPSSPSLLDTAPLIQSFAYEGIDASGTTHRGTVQGNTKREAFDRLRATQKLSLSLLSPVGVTPLFRDPDLLKWQEKDALATMTPASASPEHHGYASLIDTLRLYAGWLLVWYAAFSSIGYYSSVRVLPFHLPFSELFFFSPFLSAVASCAFLFLFASFLFSVVTQRIARYCLAFSFFALFLVLQGII